MAKSPTSAAKVLRVAVVVDDLVCDELHQSKQAGLRVGNSYKNDVVVFGSEAPLSHQMFDFRGGQYFLDLPNHARGKISLGRKAITCTGLRKRFGKGGKVRVRLDPRSRGKLMLGESTILFQFAAPKPPPPILPFPKEFRANLAAMWEPTLQYSLAGSGTVLGAFFAFQAFSEVPEDIEKDIDERFLIAMAVPPKEQPEEPPEEEPVEEDALTDKEEEEVVKKEEVKVVTKVLPKKPEKFSKQAIKQARSVGVARVLGTYGGPGEGTVMDHIAGTDNRLGELFAQGMTNTVLADGGDIGEFVPGGEGIDVTGSAVANAGLATGEGPKLEKKTEKRERKVRGRAKAGSASVSGDVDKKGFKATIRHRSRALQYCYNKALRTQPDLEGKMSFTIMISVMGTVTKVIIEEDTLGSSTVASCAKAKIKGWRFPPGADDTAEVTFPVVFSGA